MNKQSSINIGAFVGVVLTGWVPGVTSVTAQEISLVPVAVCEYEAGTCHTGGQPCVMSEDCGASDWCERICNPLTAIFGTETNDTGDPTELFLLQSGSVYQVELEVRFSGWGQAPGMATLGSFRAVLDTNGLAGTNAEPPQAGADLQIFRNHLGQYSGAYSVKFTCHSFVPPDLVNTGRPCNSPWDPCPPGTFCLNNPEWPFPIVTDEVPCWDWEEPLEWPVWCGTTHPGACVSDQPGWSAYGGTLIVDVPPAAAGTYTLAFVPAPEETFLHDCTGTNISGTTLTVGEISIGGACCLSDGSCSLATAFDCELAGGTWVASLCEGDADDDGVDEACGEAESNDSDGDGIDDSNDQCPGVDDLVFAPECAGAIPTVSNWGLAILAMALLVIGKVYYGRRGSGNVIKS